MISMNTDAKSAKPASEHLVQNEILTAFAAGQRLARVAIVWRINVGTYLTQDGRRLVHTAPNGHADLGGIILVGIPGHTPGRAFYCECKRKGGRLRPEQEAWIRMVNRSGGLAIVATSVDDVEYALRTAGYGDYLKAAAEG